MKNDNRRVSATRRSEVGRWVNRSSREVGRSWKKKSRKTYEDEIPAWAKDLEDMKKAIIDSAEQHWDKYAGG